MAVKSVSMKNQWYNKIKDTARVFEFQKTKEILWEAEEQQAAERMSKRKDEV